MPCNSAFNRVRSSRSPAGPSKFWVNGMSLTRRQLPSLSSRIVGLSFTATQSFSSGRKLNGALYFSSALIRSCPVRSFRRASLNRVPLSVSPLVHRNPELQCRQEAERRFVLLLRLDQVLPREEL